MHFGENQLAPNSISISLLISPHLMILHYQPVRTSIHFYMYFILDKIRSFGFGFLVINNMLITIVNSTSSR